jgi:hypothetical protein
MLQKTPRRGIATKTARATADEIVDAILDALEPLKSGYSRADAATFLREQLKIWCDWVKTVVSREALPQNRKDAKAVRAAVLKLAATLRGLPPNICMCFFEDHQRPELAKMTNEEMIRFFVTEPLERQKTFSGLMHSLAYRAGQLSSHAQKHDIAKRTCAERAHDFMTELSQNRPTSSLGSHYRSVTSLIYEFATGKSDVDLERACEAVLGKRREHAP